MRIATVSPGTQQMIIVLLPLLALAASLLLVYPEWMQLGTAQREVAQKEQRLRTLQETPPTIESVIPAVEDRPGEPARFLGEINDLAAVSGCTFRGWEVQTSGTPPSEGAKSEVRPVQVKITLAGRYADIRQFLARLSGAPRIYTVTALSLAPAPDSEKNILPDARLVAILTIERYLVSAT